MEKCTLVINKVEWQNFIFYAMAKFVISLLVLVNKRKRAIYIFISGGHTGQNEFEKAKKLFTFYGKLCFLLNIAFTLGQNSW